jgi:hypothetical protein
MALYSCDSTCYRHNSERIVSCNSPVVKYSMSQYYDYEAIKGSSIFNINITKSMIECALLQCTKSLFPFVILFIVSFPSEINSK